MKKISVLYFLFWLLITCFASAQVITVKQDGTGDFTMIQQAVNTAFDGDTVLVFPGIYHENVNLTNKGIYLASTWIFSHEDSLISQTIIDGNKEGSCILSLSGTIWTYIIGVTIQNGAGTNLISIRPDFYGNGGGILLEDSKMKVIKCRIKNNFGWSGAGIWTSGSSLELSGNTIFNNWAARSGGGILVFSSIVNLDSICLNNIYLNHSSSGSDIAIYYNDTPAKIWLDTATVLYPDRYYIGKFNDWAVHIERPPTSVLHCKIEQVNNDLYVSAKGDNGNSGLTPEDPLKTISFALLKIASDSINQKTVHVANGIYSDSLTGERTPIQLKNNVNLVGQSMENTIIDCENKHEGARFAYGQDYTYLKNISFTNGNGYPTGHDGGISTGYSKKLVLDSVAIIAATGDYSTGLYSDSDDTLILRNSEFRDCTGYQTVSLFINLNQSSRYNEFISCKFSGNYPDSSYDGRQLTMFLLGSDYNPSQNNTKIINCQFNDNGNQFILSDDSRTVISASENCQLDIVNSTFVNNLPVYNFYGGAISIGSGSQLNVYNSIFFGNREYQCIIGDSSNNGANSLSMNYSLVMDGINGIDNHGPSSQVIWGDGNLDTIPVFLGTEQFPYAIDAGSPCIDAGTLDLPPGITLPEYDLAGNPRVYGESVDMGAYEYGPWVGIPPVISHQPSIISQMQISPNPFSNGTHINYEMRENGRLNISVYNITGMKVKTLVNNIGSVGDKGSFYWDGKDQSGKLLPAGIYLIRLTMDRKEKETVKVVRN